MLTESSLTNILTLSGITNVRYKVFVETSTKSDLISSLTQDNQNQKLSFIDLYHELVNSNIPSAWQITPNHTSDNDHVCIELWVFWFDDQTFNLIEQQQNLKELQESKSSSFSWNQWCSGGISPTASPQPNKKYTTPSQTPGNEYMIFIKSIRALIQRNMVTKRKGFILGDFFIFPDNNSSDQAITIDEQRSSLLKTTVLAYTYNVYLTNSNLVFQPNVRRMRIRPLSSSDLYTRSLKVLLSPTGEYAKIVSFQSLPCELQSTTLDQWSRFFRIPVENLKQKSKHIPSLITIRTASQDVVVYPSVLAFVPTDTKASSSSATAGMNGIMGLNHGLTEDLGAKLTRSVYYNQLKSKSDRSNMDYGLYREPIAHSVHLVMDALSSSMMDTKYQLDQTLLYRALLEPVVPSPIMSSKSVIPSDYESPLASLRKSPTPPLHAKSQLRLTDFAISRFEEPLDENVLMIEPKDTEEPGQQPAEDQQQQQQQQQEVEIAAQDQQTDIYKAHLDMVMEDLHPPPTMNGFDMMTTTNLGSRWNANDEEEFADLSMDVTEADFDFFETIQQPAGIAQVAMPTDQVMTESIPVASMDSIPPIISAETAVLGGAALPLLSAAPIDFKTTPFCNQHENTVVEQDVRAQAATQKPSSSSVLETRAPYRSAIPELSFSVPDDFLPVTLGTPVNDAKYGIGGKFMYPSSATNDTPYKEISRYSPDYVPKFNVKESKPKQRQEKSDNVYMKNILSIDVSQSNEETNSSSSSSSSSSSGSSSSGGGDGSMYSDENKSDTDSTMSSFEDEEEADPIDPRTIERRLASLTTFQKAIACSILEPTPAPLPSDRVKQVDYDTPFVTVLFGESTSSSSSSSKRPCTTQRKQGKTMERSVSYLCQQGVLGGYPFAGGLSEVSAFGGEIEGEPAKVLVSRRTNLMQITRGVVTHVPSLQTDSVRLTSDFKKLLYDIFMQEQVAEEPEKMFLNDVPLGKISVKGPLCIQQYYDLNNQAHTKYGKYQVKKKRPNEPNLGSVSQPDIVVSRHDESLEGSPTMLTFWEKLGLHPYSVKKHIKYFVLFPNNPDIASSVQAFFKDISEVFESCYLGNHEPENTTHFPGGLVPVPLISTTEETSARQPLKKNYEDECGKLGKLLAYQPDNSYHTVIYIVNPGHHMSSYLDMCRCFHKLNEAYRKENPKKYNESRSRLVLQLVPIDHILRRSAFGGYLLQGIKDIAFSVYSKCFVTVSRKSRRSNDVEWTSIYLPPFILSKPIPTEIKYKLDDIRSFPVILEQGSKLHIAYCFSYDRAWMIVVWTDDCGELLEYGLFNRKTAYKEVWERTRQIAKRTAFSWTIVLAKIGLMFNDELTLWLRTMNHMEMHQVTIVSVDLESMLNLHFGACYSRMPTVLEQQPTTFLDNNNHYGLWSSTNSREKRDPREEMEEAQVLVLNHRVSYSQKREKAFKGILRVEAMTEKENWMTPLATGYFIHHSLPNKNVNPCMEKFNNEPFVAEIHLLYNQTSQSSYIMLHDIIKRLYALSFVNPVLSSHCCIPHHVVLAERLSRLLLILDDPILLK